MDWGLISAVVGIIGTNIALYSWLRSDIKEVRIEMKEIRSDIKTLSTSVNRIEGAILSKDCCMLTDKKPNQKAE